ncbi:type II secretion system F family protein [Hyphobacterium sp. HN65]|uniref:Type II secretion system F family protein n=1 Tax=Hyphobacterium lacteum TaxID=3116575 RepID=A0ABU7LNQ8_9PROT|nr:type II secretion system F family protein [Hyphobacterium sp. HN65]MEE2525561.1 type II secretion system F family protein [Hyphobacterium sp. HN65]
MASFAVRAIRPDGGEETIRIEAADKTAAAAAVSARGMTPIRVQPAAQSATRRASGRSRKLATRIVRELSVLIAAGLSIEPALAALSRHAADKRLKNIADTLLADVRGGASLSEAFAKRSDVFPAPFPEIAEAGEAGGALGKALGDLADNLEQRQAVEASIQGALAYPGFLMAMAIVAMAGLVSFVIPRFRGLFEQIGREVPEPAATIFGISETIAAVSPYVFAVLLVGFITLRLTLTRPAFHEAFDRWLLGLPAIGKAMRVIIAARFCRVLSLLLKNGLSAAPALRLSANAAGNRWAVRRLGDALAEVRTGRGFADRIEATNVLPPMAAELMSVGEETGDLGEASRRLADFYETQFEQNAKLTARIIEPIVIVLTGLVIGIVIISILLAMVSINDIGL